METLPETQNKKIIHYWPSDLQSLMHRDSHRFRVVICGRRFGKTWWLVTECFRMGVDAWKKNSRKARIWIVAPTFPLVKETWRVANEILRDVISDKRETDLWMDTPWVEMEFKSAERSDEGLRGAGLDGAGLDEASRIPEKAWTYGIRPALSDRMGRAVFISTPRGQNYLYHLWLDGQKENPLVKSWRFTTMEGWESIHRDNPLKLGEAKAEWNEIERTTPEMVLRQEFLADFLEDESTVFHGLSKCIRGYFEPPMNGDQYVIGVDLAKTTDFTVLTVLKLYDNQVVYVDRFREVSWDYQKRKIMSLAKDYNNAKLVVDSTGLGDPIVEDLSRHGLWVSGYKFGSTTKQELVEELMVVIEQGAIGIPEEAVDTLSELRMFEYELLPTTGRIRYSAPEGKFDDAVISLGLAVMGAKNQIFQERRCEEKPVSTGMTYGEYVAIHENTQRVVLRHPNLVLQGISGKELRKIFGRRML